MSKRKHEFDPEVLKTWISMWNTYDLSKINELFLNDPRLTYFSSEKQGIIAGIDAIREHHKGFGFVEGGKTLQNKLWLENIRTDVFGDAAVVKAIWAFQRVKSESVQRGPVTFVYIQSDHESRIVHAHFSSY